MIIKNLIRINKSEDYFVAPETLTERLRRVRALNAKPSDIGMTQFMRKTFSIANRATPGRKKI